MLQEVAYDREWRRFSRGAEFRDAYGCGAFAPTATYVCCNSTRRLDDEFRPRTDQWFYRPAGDAADSSQLIFPKLAPWLDFSENFDAVAATGPSPFLTGSSSSGSSRGSPSGVPHLFPEESCYIDGNVAEDSFSC